MQSDLSNHIIGGRKTVNEIGSEKNCGSRYETEVNLSTIRSTENAPACTDIGGIAGASSGILQSCINNGDVGYEHVGYNVGGIAGRQTGWLDSCVNNGTIRGRKDVGGICGQMEPRLTLLFDSDSLDDLWDELDTLQALMEKAISDAEGVSDDVSARMTGISDSADTVRNAASDLSDAMVDWADGNIETINDVSARISWTMDRLEPIADDMDVALDQIQEAFERLRDALGGSGAMSGAMDDIEDALGGLIAAFGRMSDAFDDLWVALSDLYIQNGGFPDIGSGGVQPGETTGTDDTGGAQAGEDETVLTRNGAITHQAVYSLARVGADTSLTATALARTGEEAEPDVPTGGGEDVDWSVVLEALDQMSGASSQIQSALVSLKDALSGVGTTAGGLLRESLDDIAAAAGDLRFSFSMLDKAAGHMEDAMDHLDDAAPHGENASALLKEAAETLGDACDQLNRAGDTFRDVMSELADKPEISFAPVGDAVNEKSDALDDAMGGLSDAMQSLNDTMSTSSDILLADMRAINNQFGKVIDVLRRHTDSDEEEEEDKDLLEDVSDQVTETDEDAGRITNAKNLGTVEGDVNVAGIVGSMAIEYDYDPEDDLIMSGDRSLNFRYQAAALTEACVNSGEVTGKKDYAGGIVGRMDLGTVSRCESYAPVESTGGDYVGGIAGAAWSTIRDCWSRCALTGNDYIGGVAGLGKTVTGCRSLVEIDEGAAYLGAVLGGMEEDGVVSGNLFTHDTLDGINGVSYLGQAEPVDFERLSQDAPTAFTRFQLVFTANGQEVETFDFSYGDALTQLPDIPQKEGYSASWPDIDYGCLTFSRTLEAKYTAYSAALTALGDPPQIVAAGTFSSDSTLSALSNEETWVDTRGVSHTGAVYTVTVTDPSQPVTAFQVQCKLSDGAGGGTVWVKTSQGWEPQDAEMDGTYLVFQAEGDSVTFTVQEASGRPMVLVIGACVCVVAAGVLIVLWRKKRNKAAG